jgi:hypothetical protein
MTTPCPKPKRRWFQFSLRTLLIFVLLVSIGMSWLGVKMELARRQREAVEAIEKAGGRVTYDSQVDAPFFDPLAEPPAPKWVRPILGDDFFCDVTRVQVGGSFGDHEASHLKALTKLVFLYLRETQVTDAGLPHLEGLTKLEWLGLDGTQITPEGVKKLKEALPDCEFGY